MTEHDLSELLDRLGERTDVGSPPTGQMVEEAARLRKRRTAVRATLAAASVAAVLGGTVAVVSMTGGDGSSNPVPGTSTPTPTPDPTPLPPRTRLVGLGPVGVAVPEDWGTNATNCGTPQEDTVVVDQGVICLALFPRPADVESVELYEGRRFEFGEDAVKTTLFEQNGLSGQQIETSCDSGGIWGAGTCRSLVYLPGEDVTFVAESSTPELAREKVDEMLSWIRPLPDGLVAVPGTSDILYGRDGQENSGTLYGERLSDAGLEVRYVEEAGPAMTPGFITDVEPAPGTVVPAGTEITVHVIAEPDGPQDQISVAMNSADVEGRQGPQVSDEEIKADARVRLHVGDQIWLYGNGKRSNTLAGELDGDALVLNDWKEGPNYGRSWDAVRPGTTRITVTIEVEGEPFELGTVTVIVE